MASKPSETNATNILSNMEALPSWVLSEQQKPTVSTMLLQFVPDELDSGFKSWCNVTEIIVKGKSLEGVDLLMAWMAFLKDRQPYVLLR